MIEGSSGRGPSVDGDDEVDGDGEGAEDAGRPCGSAAEEAQPANAKASAPTIKTFLFTTSPGSLLHHFPGKPTLFSPLSRESAEAGRLRTGPPMSG